MYAVPSMFDLTASDGVLSSSAAFLLLICLMVMMFSSIVGAITSVGIYLCVLSRCPVEVQWS